MKFKWRDVSICEVSTNYILEDGESCEVPALFMGSRNDGHRVDSRSFVHDGVGNPAGQRPDFLFRDDTRGEAILEASYEAYRADMSLSQTLA